MGDGVTKVMDRVYRTDGWYLSVQDQDGFGDVASGTWAEVASLLESVFTGPSPWMLIYWERGKAWRQDRPREPRGSN